MDKLGKTDPSPAEQPDVLVGLRESTRDLIRDLAADLHMASHLLDQQARSIESEIFRTQERYDEQQQVMETYAGADGILRLLNHRLSRGLAKETNQAIGISADVIGACRTLRRSMRKLLSVHRPNSLQPSFPSEEVADQTQPSVFAKYMNGDYAELNPLDMAILLAAEKKKQIRKHNATHVQNSAVVSCGKAFARRVGWPNTPVLNDQHGKRPHMSSKYASYFGPMHDDNDSDLSFLSDSDDEVDPHGTATFARTSSSAVSKNSAQASQKKRKRSDEEALAYRAHDEVSRPRKSLIMIFRRHTKVVGNKTVSHVNVIRAAEKTGIITTA